MGWLSNILSGVDNDPKTIEEAEVNQEIVTKNVVKNQNKETRNEVKKNWWD